MNPHACPYCGESMYTRDDDGDLMCLPCTKAERPITADVNNVFRLLVALKNEGA